MVLTARHGRGVELMMFRITVSQIQRRISDRLSAMSMECTCGEMGSGEAADETYIDLTRVGADQGLLVVSLLAPHRL